MEATKIQLDQIILNDENPRTIEDDNFHKLVKSVLTFPQMLSLRPIVIDENRIVLGGNMRTRALRYISTMEVEEMSKYLRGTKNKTHLLQEWQIWQQSKEVSVKFALGLTEEQKKEFIIKDNVAYGQWDFEALKAWEGVDLEDWGVDIQWTSNAEEEDIDDEEYKRRKAEFQERLKRGEINEDDEEYQAFLEKFEPKRTTDDCFTPANIYEVVENWVATKYNVDKKKFVRPFYPGGDYKKEKYPKGCVVVDNPPFSIQAEIIKFYQSKNIPFFLFAPSLTILCNADKCSAIVLGVGITYENKANVNTSFYTNMEAPEVKAKTEPELYKLLEEADKINLKAWSKQNPRYEYDPHVVLATLMFRLSKYGISFQLLDNECMRINAVDAQKGKNNGGIFGNGFLVSEQKKQMLDEHKKELDKRRRELEELKRQEKPDYIWPLSEREKNIVASLSKCK